MKIPDIVLKEIPINPMDNVYFVHAEDAWKRLSNVENEIIPYIYDDYASLINTLERYYKGIIKAKMMIDKEYSVPGGDIFLKDHNLCVLVNEIEHFLPLSACNTVHEYKERARFLRQLQLVYGTSRYEEYFQLSDFKELYKFVAMQRTLILDYAKTLSPIRENVYEDDYEDDYDYE